MQSVQISHNEAWKRFSWYPHRVQTGAHNPDFPFIADMQTRPGVISLPSSRELMVGSTERATILRRLRINFTFWKPRYLQHNEQYFTAVD